MVTDTGQRVQTLDWRPFLARMAWRQGEHVSLIGPTGQGKTTAALELIRERERRGGFVCVIATKPQDSTMMELVDKRGYKIVRQWPPDHGPANRVIYWPPHFSKDELPQQSKAIAGAYADMFSQGSWTIVIDETFYQSEMLNMDGWLSTLWTQGRSLNITVIACMQRPRHVPVVAYSSSSHIFVWATNDDDDLKRLSGLGKADTQMIRATVPNLPSKYHFLWINTRTGDLAISRAPSPGDNAN